MDEMKKEGARLLLKNQFYPYWKTYNITRMYREKGNLRLYRFYPTKFKEEIKTDCKILKVIYDKLPSQTSIDENTIARLKGETKLSAQNFSDSLKRIFNLYYLHIPESFHFVFPRGMLRVFAKDFYLNIKDF